MLIIVGIRDEDLSVVRHAAVQHEMRTDVSKLRTLVICGCGFPAWDGNFDALRMMCRTCFGNLTMVCVSEAPLMNVPEAAPVADKLLRQFEQAGAEYAGMGTLSQETIARLETPMIPKEAYLRQVNGL